MDIRPYKEEDEESIRGLFAACFNREISYDEWRWKYKTSPWGSSAVVTIKDGKIIAHYGGLKMRFYFNNIIYDAYQPCDVMTHPDYRARIFSKKGAMVRAAELFYDINSMDFAFGFPSERHAVLGTKQLGYTDHDYVSVLNKDMTSYVKKRFNAMMVIENNWERLKGVVIDELWEHVKNKSGLSIEKKSEYIFWRYRDNPICRYFPVILKTVFKKKIAALGVYIIKGGELHITEAMALSFKWLELLIAEIEHIAAKNEALRIVMWCSPNDNFRLKAFQKKGYSFQKGIPFIFKIINRKLDEQFLFSNYFYSAGDYDAT